MTPLFTFQLDRLRALLCVLLCCLAAGCGGGADLDEDQAEAPVQVPEPCRVEPRRCL